MSENENNNESTPVSETADAPDWKQKYFDNLQLLERKEEQWTSLDQLLRNTVSRMTLALQGIDKGLDQQLDAMRSVVRAGDDMQKLDRLSREIGETLDRLDSNAESSGSNATAPKSAAPQSKTAPGKQPPSEPGLWSRLWSKGAKAGSESGKKTAEVFDAETVHAFSQLLDQLELDEAEATERERLKEQLNSPSPDWLHFVSGVSELMASTRSRWQREKQELEQFFAQMSERLQSFDELLRVMESSRADAQQETRKLDESFRAEVRDMHSNVHGAVDMAQLKSLVQKRLDALGGYVRDYLQSQEARSSAAQARIEELSQKLASLEEETGELRARVRQQREAAQVDSLTGIYNRLAYEERIEQEYARWQRFGTAVALAVLDIDHFKRINDTYGHQAGDKVLATIASVISSNLRETDFLARYGGEEFVLIMPGATAEGGKNVVEKLRIAVQDCGFHYRGDSVPITLSCGITELQDTGHDSPVDAFARADEAMYEAKRAGRNRCQLAASR